jgi:hypothetical protein
MPGEYAAVGGGLQLSVGKMPPVPHQSFEPGIGVLDDRIQCCFRLGAGGLETVRRGLERSRLDRFHLDANLAEEIGKVRILEENADRADQGCLLRDDVIARQRSDIAAGRRQAIHDHDGRFLIAQPRQRREELFRTGRGAARAIDMDDDGADNA